MLKKRMTDIAIKLKSSTNNTSHALLMTLELAVIKKYKSKVIEQLELNIKSPKKLRQIHNQAFHHYSFKYNITDYCDDKTLRVITKYFIDASVEAKDISLFIQEFTIEKSRNELYGFSTPIELKELMVSLLDIEENDRVYNPCFGIGGFFEDIAKVSNSVSIFGEEIAETNRLIGGLTAQLSGITDCSLFKRDILLEPSYCTQKKCEKFDKVICNPPLDLSFNANKLKEDIRFNQYGIPPKNASDLVFLEHSLACMKTKAVVLVRLSILKKRSNEAKIRTAIAYDGKIETIIALPKSIIPHWKEDMALVVLSHDNKEIMFIDLDKPYFSKRKGKRNTIYKTDKILELINKREQTEHSVLVTTTTVDASSLSPKHYINKVDNVGDYRQLSEITSNIYRAQRVGGSSDDSSSYFELSINDIVENGYTTTTKIEKTGRDDRINLFKLKQFDILLPLRGKATTVGFVGELDNETVPNAGIIIIRLKDVKNAHGLYLYVKSTTGQKYLQKLYNESSNRTLNPDILATFSIPIQFDIKSMKRFNRLCKLQKHSHAIQNHINKLLNFNANMHL